MKNMMVLMAGLVCLVAASCVQMQGKVNCPHDTSVFTADNAPANSIWLDSLNLKHIKQGYRIAESGRSVDCNPMTIDKVVYKHGVGTHADSDINLNLDGKAVKFASMVGVDDEGKGLGSVAFQIFVDGKLKADSGLLRGLQKPKMLCVDLKGAKHLRLYVDHAVEDYHYDHGDWAGAFIEMKHGSDFVPTVILPVPVEPVIPMFSGIKPEPEIHGPRVVGTTPGHDFIFLIPATGEGKLTYKTDGLPEGLTLDENSGIITGKVAKEGETKVKITVTGAKGTDSRNLTIVAGKWKLAQTPPMGWNSWNIYGLKVTADDIKKTADSMVKSGLAAYGFQYVNIDDGWEDKRDENGIMKTNAKFGDMKKLSDYVHSLGLKLGIYSSPGPQTCGLFEGSWQHEELDAITYAGWGIDYLKYDWCLYEKIAKDKSLPELKKPYILMREKLDMCGRDIVYSLCQYGMGNVWEWGGEIGGNLWRTTGDITDTWESMSTKGFDLNGKAMYAKPGNWNDPDMLVVGWLGWGDLPYPSKLLPNEQVTHITMWSLSASPLLLGCDVSKTDKLTLDLLTNHDVIEINQDPLGIQAERIWKNGEFEVWSKSIWDGTKAVGLFNRSLKRENVSIDWKMLGFSGSQPVYDVWQRKTLGEFENSFTAEVPVHGAIFIKVGKTVKTDY